MQTEVVGLIVDEEARMRLHRSAEAVLGSEEASTLMATLPPIAWQHVAMKDDVRELGTDVRSEISRQGAELRSEMSQQGAELRLEMTELRSEVRSEMSELRSEVRELGAELRMEMIQLGTELRVEMHQGFIRQTKWMAGLMTVWSGLMLTAIGVFFG